MDRRDFIKTTGTLVAGAHLAPHAMADAAVTKSGGRMILPMNRNWRYGRTSSDAAHARDFDASAFDLITIPHTNMPLPWHSFDKKTYEFFSFFRRHFKLPAE